MGWTVNTSAILPISIFYRSKAFKSVHSHFSTPPRGVKLTTLIVFYLHPLHGIPYLQALKLPLCLPADSHKNVLSWLTHILPLWWREPLLPSKRASFYKRGESDIILRKKFVMSLFRTIFVFGNGREVANLGFVFTECLRSAFASEGEEKHKAMRQQRHGTNKSSFLCNRRSLASA